MTSLFVGLFVIGLTITLGPFITNVLERMIEHYLDKK